MYKFKEIENRQQKLWQDHKLFKTNLRTDKKRYYVLEMFAYPSGSLHMGHVRNYSIGDVIARYKRMKGYEVLHPVGWDSFGLPAENAAIKRGIHPKDWTEKNIEQMRQQLQSLGISYDWDREITTSRPEYYKWNQWIFSRMFEKGLAYKRKAFVNWSESMQTVLANEQVEASFCTDKNDIVQKELNQWFFKITEYADELIEGLDEIDWPESVKTMQVNWIGRSEGVNLELEIPGFEAITAFTTRLDTIYGITYVAISKGHPLVENLKNPKIKEFIEYTPTNKDEKNRLSRGIFTGHYAVNPANGERVPIWIADYVIDYGTKAVIGVPAHDERDYAFAMENGLKVKEVISSETIPNSTKGILCNSEEFTGLESNLAIERILAKLSVNSQAEKRINYRLKDWLISRQRYWGTPIPVIYEGEEVKLAEIPVLLPEDVEFTGRGNPIATSKSFGANRETDTMDTFVDSSWYYLRYLDNKNNDEIFDRELSKLWPQVDIYIGGVEHAVMHLLYSRFIHKVLKEEGAVESREPFKKLLTQGMVLSHSYYNKNDGKYYFPQEAEKFSRDDLIVTLEKMSKSKNNGVAPEEMAEKYGVDAMRIFILFAAPPEKDLEWSESGIAGARRFLNKLYNLVSEESKDDTSKEAERDLLRKLHQTISKVDECLEKTLHFNVAIAALMELTNECQKYKGKVSEKVFKEVIRDLIKMLSPFAPHLADELFQEMGGEFLINESWPQLDEKFLDREEISIPVQVNGKLRGTIIVSKSSTLEVIIEAAREAVYKYLGSEVKKELYIPGKIVNFIV